MSSSCCNGKPDHTLWWFIVLLNIKVDVIKNSQASELIGNGTVSIIQCV